MLQATAAVDLSLILLPTIAWSYQKLFGLMAYWNSMARGCCFENQGLGGTLFLVDQLASVGDRIRE